MKFLMWHHTIIGSVRYSYELFSVFRCVLLTLKLVPDVCVTFSMLVLMQLRSSCDDESYRKIVLLLQSRIYPTALLLVNYTEFNQG
jgi:hypothetical protein